MRNLNYFLCLVTICFILSCENSDKRVNFGNYFIYKPKYGFDYDEYGISGNGIYKQDIIDSPVGLPIVLPTITNFEHSGNFILVKNSYDEEASKKILEITLWLNQDTIKLKSIVDFSRNKSAFLNPQLYSIKNPNIDSIFSKDRYFKNLRKSKIGYYIINKRKNWFIGPLSYEEYTNKTDSLGIDINKLAK